jgi:hypothetical protein
MPSPLRAALVVEESHLSGVVDVVAGVSAGRVASMRRQGAMLWRQYLSSPRALALAALHVLNARVFPYATPRAYQDWNDPVPADKVRSVFQRIHLISMSHIQSSRFEGGDGNGIDDFCHFKPLMCFYL